MSEICTQAQNLAEEIFRNFKLDLRATVAEMPDGCLLNFHGEDAVLLHSENGELLNAVEHLLNQTLTRDPQTKIFCDVDNFRADREAELRAMAKHAAQQAVKTGIPFVFAPMDAKERRILHTTLTDNLDVATESTGEGNQRRVCVRRK